MQTYQFSLNYEQVNGLFFFIQVYMGGEKSHTFAIFSGNELVSGIVLNQNYKLNSFDTDFYINSYHSRETFILVGHRTGQIMKIFTV